MGPYDTAGLRRVTTLFLAPSCSSTVALRLYGFDHDLFLATLPRPFFLIVWSPSTPLALVKTAVAFFEDALLYLQGWANTLKSTLNITQCMTFIRETNMEWMQKSTFRSSGNCQFLETPLSPWTVILGQDQRKDTIPELRLKGKLTDIIEKYIKLNKNFTIVLLLRNTCFGGQ